MTDTFPSLAPLVEGFFIERLMTQRQVSNQTILAYRDTFRLLLRYAQQELNKAPSMLGLGDLSATFLCAFLNHLEQNRHNSARTRNHRLAAIRSFFRYAAFRVPQLSAHIQCVLAIPSKRWKKPLISFLTLDEVDALLGVIDKGSWIGRRDYALLSLAVHTGLRVSELISLRCEDVSLDPVASVRCRGKGRKERCTPVGKTLRKTLEQWLRERGGNSSDSLFPNRCGGSFSRDGVQYLLRKYVAIAQKTCPSIANKRVTPHVLRHTTAVHLLQAGVDLSAIALWLGHESPESTQVYIDLDLKHKQRILEKTIAIDCKPLLFHPDDGLLAFLQGL